jgi:methylated-DNA-[protein]-cysteine S-methyltransferase
MTRTFDIVDSPVGPLLLVAEDGALVRCAFWKGRNGPPGLEREQHALAPWATELKEYFAGERRDFEQPIHLHGPRFHMSVWNALREIPYGKTVSYGDIARRIGQPAAVRAVGSANGANPIAIIVPCHRVIGANGKLTGYGGGLERKQLLLDLEQGVPSLL